jgi:hypothetical protein
MSLFVLDTDILTLRPGERGRCCHPQPARLRPRAGLERPGLVRLIRRRKHLANAQIARRIALVCQRLGYRMPMICTPEELMGE